MGDRTKISWTDATWNPVVGCSHVSEGCRFCYAEALSLGLGWSRLPWTAQNAAQNVKVLPERLDQPLRWKKPRMIFVNSMSDLFHEQVPDEFIDHVVGVMTRCPQHTFQVLTKRPQRMMEYFTSPAHAAGLATTGADFPLPNVWLGVSVEDQRTANDRVPCLLQTPAAVRWISAEPLLEEVRLDWLGPDGEEWAGTDALTGERRGDHENPDRSEWLDHHIDWVVCGGESGPNARPMDIKWAQDLRRQCKEVAFFMKQLSQADSQPITDENGNQIKGMVSRKRWFRELSFFPEDLRVREWPVTGQIPVAVAVPEPDNLSRTLFPMQEGAGHG